jgi:5-formyltetrahydrofolate cyclo-ligase
MCKREQKRQLRAEIRRRKEHHTQEELVTLSSSVLNEIEKLAAFKKAANILLYYSLDDEVQTASFIKKWYKRKCILLPVMNGDELELKIYKGEEYTDKKTHFT